MKITKATIKRINACANPNKPNFKYAIYVIGDILYRAKVILKDCESYSVNDGSNPYIDSPVFFSDGVREFVSGSVRDDYDKRIIAGLATKYPRWISGTFTHSLDGVDIYEVNKLVKAVLDD